MHQSPIQPHVSAADNCVERYVSPGRAHVLPELGLAGTAPAWEEIAMPAVLQIVDCREWSSVCIYSPLVTFFASSPRDTVEANVAKNMNRVLDIVCSTRAHAL